MSWAELQKQPQLVSMLKGALENNRLPHGFLFLGPAGSGQMETAKALAKTLFCGSAKDQDPCDVCVHCKQVDKGSHPDLMLLEPDGESATIKIEQIRDLIAKANLKPFQASCKVFVIHRAECMNDVSQNALLKTLEEPEGRSFFILISPHPDRLLETIRSRVQTLNFRPAETHEEWEPEEAALRNEVLSYAQRVMDAGKGGAAPDLSKTDRRLVGRILDHLIGHLRDALVLKIGANDILRRAEDLPAKRALAERHGEDELGEAIEQIAEFREKILENINVRLAMGVLWESLAKKSYVR
ncbi:MAG: DNA polymerase III subunit delta' [Candidatus Omnitrophota bacterium]